MKTTEAPKLVTFRLGEDLFAVDIFAVERVLRYQTPRTLPDVPAWIEGVIEYQGRVVPVLNLRRRFELPALAPAPETRIVVLNARGEWIGAVVDSVLEVSTIDTSRISSPPGFFRGLAGQYLKGIARHRLNSARDGRASGQRANVAVAAASAEGGASERLVIVLDVEQLLSATERIALERARGTPVGGSAVVDV